MTILIIGAGISGLAFAQSLLQANMPFRIFERDSADNVRSQGYRVRINGEGILALTQMLPAQLFSRLQACCAHVTYSERTNPTAQAAILNALSGEKIEKQLIGGRMPPPMRKGLDQQPLNLDRSVLRSVLMMGLESFVEYGREVVGYEIEHGTAEGGEVTVRFSDGGQARGALLVGADGARSRIRKQLVPEHLLVDTEGRWIYGKTLLTPKLVEMFSEEALKGMTVVQDLEGEVPRALLLEAIRFKDNEFRGELPADYVYWVLMSRKDTLEGMTESHSDEGLLNMSAQEAATLSQTLTSNWHSSFHALFALQETSQAALLRIASAKPQIPIWEPSNAVTLIGDAAHVMSPTAGVGAVSALRDAAALSQVLKEGGINGKSIGKYEALMRQYAGEAISKSYFGGKVMFGMRPFEEMRTLAS